MYATFFNKTMLQTYGLEDPYTLVANNEWTVDKMFSMCKEIYTDAGEPGNCVNIGNVSAGRYGAGIVGLAYAAGSYDLIAEQCVNYGTITGKYSAAGIVGQNNGASLGVSIRRCANYGDISNASGNQAGGMMAYAKPSSSSGVIDLSNNINYGYIHNTNIDATNCQIAGIFTRMNGGGGTLYLKGNVNYNELKLQDGYTAQVVFGIMSVATGGLKKTDCEIEHNYSVHVEPIANTTAPESVGMRRS